MPPQAVTRRGVLYLIVCAAPPARDADRLVQLAPEEGRYLPTARALVTHLLHRERAGRKQELRALAERVSAVA